MERSGLERLGAIGHQPWAFIDQSGVDLDQVCPCPNLGQCVGGIENPTDADDRVAGTERLAQLAEVDFTNQTNPRPAKAADYERLLKQAM